MQNKEITGKTFPLKGAFYLKIETPLFGIKLDKSEEGSYKLLAKGSCSRGSHSTYM